MRQSLRKNLTQIRIKTIFETGWCAVVCSPQRAVRVGIRTKIGWWIMLCGVWLIFGKAKEFQTITNLREEDDRM